MARALAGSLALCMLLCAALCGCKQKDDVVAQISAALAGAGGSGGQAGAAGQAGSGPTLPSAIPPECNPPMDYARLREIAADPMCAVALSPSQEALLRVFFAQETPSQLPGEAQPFSECAISLFRVFYSDPATGDSLLCPTHCANLRDYVQRTDERILACVLEQSMQSM